MVVKHQKLLACCSTKVYSWGIPPPPSALSLQLSHVSSTINSTQLSACCLQIWMQSCNMLHYYASLIVTWHIVGSHFPHFICSPNTSIFSDQLNYTSAILTLLCVMGKKKRKPWAQNWCIQLSFYKQQKTTGKLNFQTNHYLKYVVDICRKHVIQCQQKVKHAYTTGLSCTRHFTRTWTSHWSLIIRVMTLLQ